jgi:hypothetical protein
MNTDDLRTGMRAVFIAKLSNSGKVPLRRDSFDSTKENTVTNEYGCYGVLSKKINAVTPVRPFSPNKENLTENTLCSVCGARGDLWHFGEALVHQECARLLPKPEHEPSAAYHATSADPATGGCSVTVIGLPRAQRYRKTFAALQMKPPALVDVARWRQCVEDGSKFLALWGEQAQALNWNSADLFGLTPVPDRPHPSFSRMSRYDQTGLIWLLQGRRVTALSESTGAIENPATGSVTVYRKHNKQALGPLGDSIDDLDWLICVT